MFRAAMLACHHKFIIKFTFPDPMPTQPDTTAIRYRIEPSTPEAHLFSIECTIPQPSPDGETFALPAWIPGSYLIRDFARHIESFFAHTDNAKHSVTVEKLNKDTWQVKTSKTARTLTVRYNVYANDLSVRGAHLDTTHGFFNGSSVFLRVIGREDSPCKLEIAPPKSENCRNWRVATSLPVAPSTQPLNFGHYTASDYNDLIDHPVEMGEFDLFEFKAGGIDHRFALTGRHHADLPRLKRDLKKICAWQTTFWGKPLPTKNYTFLTTALGDGYGGLEHRASTALICRRDDLPKRGDKNISKQYLQFLGLASHEYFHTWLVKRIKPAEFIDLDLQHENPTELLWLFEGFTSYYDDLSLLRCGLIDVETYLSCLGKTLGRALTTPGRLQQSVAAASFDAWIKLYKPDENTTNTSVSYYAKGALVALALDLHIRESSAGKHSLDDLMRRLWQEHGITGKGVHEADVHRLAEALAGKSLAKFFHQALHETKDLPIRKLLAKFGIKLTFPESDAPSLGIELSPANGLNEAKIAVVQNGGAAQLAGISAHDVLLAINGLRVTPSNLDSLLATYAVGDKIALHVFRRDELMRFSVQLQATAPTTCLLSLASQPATSVKKRHNAWLRNN